MVQKGLLLVGLSLALVGFWVAPGLADTEPSDFFVEEFTFGLLGGLIGGPVVEAVYVNILCREAPEPQLCEGFSIVTMRAVVYTIPLPLGATVGIVAAGLFRGIHGNWLFAIFSAVGGSLTGWATATSIVMVMEYFILSAGWGFLEDWVAPVATITRLALPILYAAFFGTIGFNTGETMRQSIPSTALVGLSWSVSLFSERF